MDATADFLIRSEEDFLNFLETVKSWEGLESEEFLFPNVKFEGWPVLDINVKGERYHSSITSAMLFGMSILNEEIQRAFATIRYGSQNLQRLTNEDKQRLDIVFNISEGSSDAEGVTDKIINAVTSFLRDSMTGMTGWQKMLVVIAIVGAASTCGYHYISENAETERHATDRQVEIAQTTSDGINKAISATLDYKINGKSATSEEVTNHGLAGKSALVKQLAADPTVESVTLGNEQLSREELNKFNGRQAVDRERLEKTDTFFVKGVTRTGPTNQDININVVRVSNADGFTIKASADVITQSELTAITDALSNNKTIKIRYLEVIEKGAISLGQFNTIATD
ncbi:hypothetical protein [Cronobacter dublinensis]|uniref:hypothetical protein n=1 Tax=Cronobacter dublinensis TaxID=413497 RepID=UPI002A17E5A3|nr:hypothetical protein [Cronobacter sakazakii]